MADTILDDIEMEPLRAPGGGGSDLRGRHLLLELRLEAEDIKPRLHNAKPWTECASLTGDGSPK